MPDIATVELKLGQKTYKLVPTYRVVEAVSQRFGGHAKAIEAVSSLDVQAMVRIIQTATPKITDAEVKALPKLLFEAKLPVAAVPLIEFLAILANGGQPLPKPGENGDDGDDKTEETGETGEG